MTAKDSEFPVSVRWRGGDLTFASAHGNVLRVSDPPELGGTGANWNPEELVIGAAATCFVLSVATAATRARIPLIDASVKACGSLAPQQQSGPRLTHIRIDATLETLPGHEADVRETALACVEDYVVADALAVPLDIRVHVHAVEARATQRALHAGLD